MGKGLLMLLVWKCVLVVAIEAAPEGSIVTHLPGFTSVFPSKHYSGYIKIDQIESGKRLFYYFVTSERSPAEDPVVLWLNGGPGCSSFDAFVYEHGPFNFEEGKPKGTLPTLHLNPYSWSKVSNIIYLDSPAGVGLSYSSNKDNYITGDIQTASDTHNFLLKWFKEFPEFLKNPFYIAGESFAGIYVPTLASQLVKGLKSGVVPVINLKGYMVGNGVTDQKFDGNALVPFAYGMALISDAIFKEAEASCGGNYYSPQTSECFDKLDRVDQALEGLNIYDILEPCYHTPSTKMNESNTNLPPSFQQLGETEKPLAVRTRMFGRAWPFRAPVRDGIVPLWPQLAHDNTKSTVLCMNDEVATTWLNDESVRMAIHAEPQSVIGPWELCTHRISYSHNAGSMIPYHRNLTSQGYKALIFSGDHDMCVPYTGSQAWTSSLGYKIVDEWRPWFSNSQVSGYLQGYEHNLTFITIKGAGHTVPEYKPREALDFYSRWLEGNPI
ncbi:serine carboxypeptidase 1-like isoform X1 [Benincasa hispida]|uniref:serine carboxypeptidase 1-like isoform X1 n=1 Tax=Benincasa hispida TaxID=102211 RepID=UPI001902AB7B|nr:serine carboxypeptidase 1-like isoform X1 [Benincasa hispida]